MTELLTSAGYEQTKTKLAQLEGRLAVIEQRPDLDPEHKKEVRQSYLRMMQQYRREINLYEATFADQSR